MRFGSFDWGALVCSALLVACAPPGEGGGEGGGDEGGGGSDAQVATTTGTSAEPTSSSAPRPCDGFATNVVEVEYGPGAGFGKADMPGIVLGPPAGTGELMGSLDVVSLGNGGSITLAFGGAIVDEEGPDFVVFENVFFAGGDPSTPWAEIASVEVSADGETWVAFPCTATAAPYDGCAGWHPTYAGSTEGIDPHDPAEAGGDAFDLADVELSEARFVRIVDRADLAGFSGSFDLDAVSLVHWACDAP